MCIRDRYKSTFKSLNSNNSITHNGKTYAQYDVTYTIDNTAMPEGGFRIMCRGFDFLLDDICAYQYVQMETEDFTGLSVYAERDKIEMCIRDRNAYYISRGQRKGHIRRKAGADKCFA